MNIAIILSAGSGSRFGSDIPKQFINLAGKNIIEYTIAAFEQNDKIDEICIVADTIYHERLLEISKNNNFTKVKKVIQGGVERKDSSYNAIKEYEDKKNINLIFHDAVRPFVSQRIINDCIESLEKYNAIDVAIPTADTIIQIDEISKTIENIPQRSKLQRGQTPQAFKLEIIKKAHELAIEDINEPMFTDDCGLVKQYLPNEKIFVVNGEEKNIKITYKEDLLFAEKLIQFSSISLYKKPLFNDLKGKVIVVFGGNSGIGKEIVKTANEHKAKAVSFSRKNGVDIVLKKDVKKALKKVFQKYGKIDSVVNCAAVLTKKELIDIHFKDIQKEININLLGSVNIAKASYKYLKQTKGSLILFTSSSYTRGRASYSLYSSTKAAVVNLTQALASEWQKDSIKVNVICPARTKTPMREDNFGKEDSKTLLNAKAVAQSSLQTILEDFSGLVIDIKKEIH
ncbi:2-C-methyl-D-erythritol 4-phosphate cytidylyltransferase [Aliarcobacter butzleri]|uniref:2-C-methyl-D-erythritol 4-phosphate cytidylyltransferase n=1 Tax=Aliarcobacter butzleri TaxID=28197 RepID=A0AAW7QEV5_9BACT|nr:2-C-methyl-D-erythritol 4-phosphate cytidylyltransferase [Aliarcobacter butzleri]MDN5107352.1 2-C-methyl-D-erythritol 4-phosphate cytidylyltransferase [Aliarcobacter butzleri]MDN5124361.1 2-C-methyl-D-erythritol 4-phosphate cytidylyltransferase [Aliarcobacter butzleri]